MRSIYETAKLPKVHSVVFIHTLAETEALRDICVLS